MAASRRIAKTAIDWTAFKERVPPNQQEFFRAFKAKNEKFVNAVHMYPADLPKIDFANYKRMLPNPALADQFQKAYEGLKIPYPTDKDKLVQKVEEDQKEAAQMSAVFVKERQADINDATMLLSKIKLIPKSSEMTLEMFTYYFPDAALDPVKRPTFWPHNPEDQPGHPDSKLIN